MENPVIAAFRAEFSRYRGLAEGAAAQVPFEQWRIPLGRETNSIAVIMKHVGGNLRSRWTDPFTTDGEKPWRNRDSEFIDDLADRAALEEHWRAGWKAIESLLAHSTDADLPRTLHIRGEPHTFALALVRSVSHVAYHSGQIVLLARHLAETHGLPWRTLTVARGGSRSFNQAMGYDAERQPPGA